MRGRRGAERGDYKVTIDVAMENLCSNGILQVETQTISLSNKKIQANSALLSTLPTTYRELMYEGGIKMTGDFFASQCH